MRSTHLVCLCDLIADGAGSFLEYVLREEAVDHLRTKDSFGILLKNGKTFSRKPEVSEAEQANSGGSADCI